MIWDWLTANWFSVLSFIIGITLTTVIYHWQKKEKRPRYSKRNVLIIENAKQTFPTLTVHYKGFGEDLDNLSVTVIAIWNAGCETIHGSDITSTDPLMVKVKEGTKILGASIIQQNNSASSVACEFSKSSNCVRINFDYLDYRQGAVIEVLHTGISREAVRVDGKIKGAGEIKENTDMNVRPPRIFGGLFLRRRMSRRFRSYFLIGLGMCNILFMIIFLYNDYYKKAFDVVEIDGIRFGVIPEGYLVKVNGEGFAAYKSPFWGAVSGCTAAILTLTYVLLGLVHLQIGPPPSLDKFDDHLTR